MSARCRIGWHTWEVLQEASYLNAYWELLAIPTIKAERGCVRCGKVQVRDEHCLGLNPPDYVYTWYEPKDTV